jgi:hypothetical protein
MNTETREDGGIRGKRHCEGRDRLRARLFHSRFELVEQVEDSPK